MSALNENTLAREYAFKFLFHLTLPQFAELKNELAEDVESLQSSLAEFDESYSRPDSEHLDNKAGPTVKSNAVKLIKYLLANYEDIKAKISAHLTARKFENLDRVESTVLMLTTAEFLQSSNTPTAVIIDEAILLAKKYGSEGSSAFVNGVLDAIAKSGK